MAKQPKTAENGHEGTEAVATIGGAAGGAAAGAAAGSLLGPIGAAVGAVVGGVGGAIAGRDAANGKLAPEVKRAAGTVKKAVKKVAAAKPVKKVARRRSPQARRR